MTLLWKNQAVGPIEMLVDSGADHCTIDRNLGQALGLDVESGIKSFFTGAGGGGKAVWFHRIQMEVEGRRFDCQCGFCDLGGLPSLLGRDGFFNRFCVMIDERKQTVTLKYRDEDLTRVHC